MMRFLCVLSAAWCGCAVAPERTRLEETIVIPDSWVAASLSAGKIESRWWEGFANPQLNALVDDALLENPTLMATASRVFEAAAAARFIGADSRPQLDAAFFAQRQRLQFVSPLSQEPDTLRRNTYGLSLNVSWELDIWGRLRARESAALADLAAQQAVFDGAVLSLIAQVIKAYFFCGESWGQLQIAESNLRSAEALGERIEDRFQSGLRPALDLRLILDDVAVARAAQVRARQRYEDGRRQLELLLGRYPEAAIEASAVLPAERPEIPSGLPADLLWRRPDLVAAERDLAASDARLTASRKDLLPRIALTAAGGTAADELSDIFDKDLGVWNILGNLVQPLFDGGRRRAEIDRTAAVQQGALARFVEVALLAFGEVESALADEQHLRDLEVALADAVQESSSSLAISQDRYFSGVSDILSILEARRRYFTAQAALLAVQLERLDNRVDLYVALGGGYEGYAP